MRQTASPPSPLATVPATAASVPKLCIAAREAALAMGLPARTADRVELALAELANNIVRHGAFTNCRTAQIALSRLEAPDLTLLVDDTAVAAAPSSAPEGFPDPLTLPTGGFGLALVHACADAFHTTHDQSGNHAVLIFRPHPDERDTS
jgi:anti-sigma regulatory factor (Ser/Thr protein kinase)